MGKIYIFLGGGGGGSSTLFFLFSFLETVYISTVCVVWLFLSGWWRCAREPGWPTSTTEHISAVAVVELVGQGGATAPRPSPDTTTFLSLYLSLSLGITTGTQYFYLRHGTELSQIRILSNIKERKTSFQSRNAQNTGSNLTIETGVDCW